MNTGYKKSVMSIILRLLVIIAACVTSGVLLFIVGYKIGRASCRERV